MEKDGFFVKLFGESKLVYLNITDVNMEMPPRGIIYAKIKESVSK